MILFSFTGFFSRPFSERGKEIELLIQIINLKCIFYFRKINQQSIKDLKKCLKGREF